MRTAVVDGNHNGPEAPRSTSQDSPSNSPDAYSSPLPNNSR
jgi:hypothetical protein